MSEDFLRHIIQQRDLLWENFYAAKVPFERENKSLLSIFDWRALAEALDHLIDEIKDTLPEGNRTGWRMDLLEDDGNG